VTYKNRDSAGRLEPFPSQLPLNQYTISGLVAITAIIIGLAVGQGHWIIALGALAIPLVLLYPVHIAFGVFALLVPFDEIAAIGEASHGRTVTWFAGVGAVLVLLVAGLATRRFRRAPAAGIWWLSFAGWSALTTVWALSPEVSLERIPTALSLVGLYLVVGCLRFTKSELKAIVFLSILGGLIAAAWTLYSFHQGNFFDARNRASLMIGDRETNPNQLGLSLVLPISLAFGWFLSCKRWLGRAVLLFAMSVTALALFFTMSRGAVVALVTALCVYLYRLRIGKRLVVPIAVLGLVLSFVPSVFFVRFQEAAATRGAGRLDIWKVGLTALTHYGLVGAGLDNFPLAYTKYAGDASHFKGFFRDPHNVYLSVAVETGVLGLILFVGAIGIQLRSARRVKHGVSPQNLLLATEAATWGLLAFGLVGTILWEKVFWLSWILLTAATQTLEDAPPFERVASETSS